jgi:hypothetical protein
VIKIAPQGGFLGELAIILPTGEPGIVILAVAGPGGPISGPVRPAPGPGVPALPVNPVAMVPVLTGPARPALVDPLARI